MFYGRFKNEADRKIFKDALDHFKQIFKSVYAGDNVILFDRALGITRDKKFMAAFRANARTAQEKSLLLRLNTLAWAATEALRLPGDFIECGVFRGFSMGVIADYLDFQNIAKRLYLYDTFSGIPPGYDTENHDSPVLHEKGLYEFVCGRFARFPNVHVVRGIVPDSFTELVPEQISFLHLDMNSSKSEIAALEVLFDRLSPGGIVVFDDYGWASYQAQQIAEDLFVQKRGHRILEIPSGQGLLIKH